MRPPFDEITLNKINNSDKLQASERIELFIELNSKYEFSVIPCRGGFAKDPNNQKEVRDLKSPIWKNYPQHCFKITKNLQSKYFRSERAGICCGPASNLLVLDIDNPDMFQQWCQQKGIEIDFSDTLVISTGRATVGYHVYFEYPKPPKSYEYRTKKFEPIFSIQALGSIAIAPGSLHPATRSVYKVINNKPIQKPPQWIIDIVLTKEDGKKKMENTEENKNPTVNEVFTNLVLKSEHELTDAQIAMLNKDVPSGERSEKIFSAILSLLNSGKNDDDIIDIILEVPLGKRAYEKKNPREYISSEINRAKEKINSQASIHSSRDQVTKKKNNNKSNRYQDVVSMTLDEIQATTVQFEFLIKDLWPKGESFLLSGEGGCGKSLFALNLALDLVAEGNTKFLEIFDVIGDNRVLFLQSENSKLMTKSRIDIITNKYQIYSNYLNKIRFLGINGDIKISGDFVKDKKFKELVLSQISEHKSNVLIIDPLISFHSADENSNDKMRKVMDSIIEVADKHKISIVVIHHETKDFIKAKKAGGRGASAIGDWAAYSFNLMPPRKNMGYHRLTPNKSRDLELPPAIQLHLSKDLRFIPYTSSQVPAVLTLQNIILSIVKAKKKINSFNDFYEEYKKYCTANNIKPAAINTFRKDVKNMVSKNVLKESNTTPRQYTL